MAKAKSTTTKKRKTDTTCSPKKLLTTSIIAFAITFAYDWLVHGKLLMATYKATASMWRPESEMNAMFGYCIAKHAIEAVLFTSLLMHWKCSQTPGALFSTDCPVRKGFCFGSTIGLLLGVSSASAYIYMPIPQELALSWLAAETIKWGLAGGILNALCNRCTK